MVAPEMSLLVVKPDGVAKGLSGKIRELLRAVGLAIKEEATKVLTPEVVVALYWDISDIRHRDYFPQLVEFMSSAPVHIFVVEGEDAVRKVRRVIGKRFPPSGVRQQWAESIIKNVAHGPHTLEAAQREIRLLTGGWNTRRVFLVGGMSESGKSTLGRYLDSKGITRLKIVSFLRAVMAREGARGDFQEWNNRNVAERPEWVRHEFSREFLRWVEERGIEYCCLESLYGPELGVYLRNLLGPDRVVIVYVGAPLEVRLQRQIVRQNLGSTEEAKAHLLPRDKIKRAWLVPDIERVADVVIDNSGSLDDLCRAADRMIVQYCPELAKP